MQSTSNGLSVVWRLAWLVVGFLVTHVVAAHAGEATPAPQSIQQVAEKAASSPRPAPAFSSPRRVRC